MVIVAEMPGTYRTRHQDSRRGFLVRVPHGTRIRMEVRLTMLFVGVDEVARNGGYTFGKPAECTPTESHSLYKEP